MRHQVNVIFYYNEDFKFFEDSFN